MSERNFRELIENKWSEGKFVCVGLDTKLDKVPESARRFDIVPTTDVVGNVNGHVKSLNSEDTIVGFNFAIVMSTCDDVCAYKLNSAFYEAEGVRGIAALKRTIDDIHRIAPSVPVILDAKRGDILDTNKQYAQFAFDYLGADAITVHPYMGIGSLKPFLERSNKGVFILCRTTNPEARGIQNLPIRTSIIDRGPLYRPLHDFVAELIQKEATKYQNIGLVAGATNPSELADIRKRVGDMPILIPGIGAQGGDLEQTVEAGQDSHGRGMIIGASRSIIYASNGDDFAQAAQRETRRLSTQIYNLLLQEGRNE